MANSYQANKWNGEVTQFAYKVGEFEPLEDIKLWMKSTYGEVTYSNIPQWFDYQGAYGINGTDVCGNTLAKVDFDYGGETVFFSIAEDHVPLGQPLPGCLTTMMIGGVCTGFAYIKSKRKKEINV